VKVVNVEGPIEHVAVAFTDDLALLYNFNNAQWFRARMDSEALAP
jgi:hypothetical protein